MTIKAAAPQRSMWLTSLGLVAMLFGVVTVMSGGGVLFGGEGPRLAAGAYVPFVLWFNFSSGFLYVPIGAGLILAQGWAARAAALLAVAVLIVFAAFGLHIANGSCLRTPNGGSHDGSRTPLADHCRHCMPRPRLPME